MNHSRGPASPTAVLFIDHCAHLSGAQLALEGLLAALGERDDVALVGLSVSSRGPMVDRWQRLLPVEVLSDADGTARRITRRGMKVSAVPALIGEAVRVRRSIQRARRNHPDAVVYFNTLRGFAVARPLVPRSAPVVVHARDRIEGYFSPRASKLLVWALGRADAIVANSDGTAAELVAAGISRTKVTTVMSPLRSEFRTERPAAADSDRRKLAVIGTITPWKGQDLAIRAVGELLGRGADVELHVIGSPQFGDLDFETELAELARQHRGHSVTFHGQVADVAARLGELGVGTVVHTSRLPEPLGMSVVEALALGLTVVAADAGGPSELITDGVNGLLYRPNDLGDLVAALERAFSPVGAAVATNARASVGQRFDPATLAERTLRVLADAAER